MPYAPELTGVALGGRYALDAPIGEGAFGRVYRGHDLRLDRPVAVKVIKPWWAEDPAWVAAFEREAKMLAQLSDPGIVQIFDVGQVAEGLFYVSELVDGEDLARRLARGPIPAGEAVMIAEGLCRALAAAHAKRIVHRDVKPANVLLARDRRSAAGLGGMQIKIADFGVARLAEGTTGHDGRNGSATAIVGTPRYMAPEQGRGGQVTPATDVYSAGVVLYEMLAGHTPFEAASAVELAVRHLQDAPPTLPDTVDPALGEVVMRALAKDPGGRYSDGAAMARALRQAMTRSPTRPAPSAPAAADARPDTERAPRLSAVRIVNPSGRRRTIAVLAAVIALVGALALAAMLAGHSGHHHRRVVAAAPVDVPLVVGDTTAQARASLRSLGLRVTVTAVPAPGVQPGTVTGQSPRGGRTVKAHGTVALQVAEVPRWRTVETITSAGQAVTIRGERWRIIPSATSARHCTLLIFCSNSSVSVERLDGSSVASFSLSNGTGGAQVLRTGPGTYTVKVHPADGSARWSLRVQDDY